MKLTCQPSALLLGYIITTCTTHGALATIIPPFPNGVPGSGYGCDNTCDGGDVNYVIRASLEVYKIKGSSKSRDFDADASAFTRTFKGDSVSSPFCYGMSGTDGPLGPCLTVNPNQTIYIKIINDMDNGTALLKQGRTQLEILQTLSGNPNTNSSGYLGTQFSTVVEENVPGFETSFDVVNIHMHGMQVVPHLFHPQGTGDPAAEWISIHPTNENPEQRCHCYVFDIPADHPMGTFWYHIHRHGSASIQGWQGMAGLIEVGNASIPGSPRNDLERQGVTRHEPMVLWEWVISKNNQWEGDPTGNTFFEGAFYDIFSNLTGVTFTLLNNNEFQPTIDLQVNETVHVPLLCAQTSTGKATLSSPLLRRCPVFN